MDRLVFGILPIARQQAWRERLARQFLGLVSTTVPARLGEKEALLVVGRDAELYWLSTDQGRVPDALQGRVAELLTVSSTALSAGSAASDETE